MPNPCGCRLCRGEAPGPGWTDGDRKLVADVEGHGWHVVKIPAEGEAPGWAFTVGLRHSFGTPEVGMFGLPLDVLHVALNDLGEAARKGDPLPIGVRRDDVLERYDVELCPVDAGWHRSLFGYAQWFFPSGGVEFRQCVWPDQAGRFPWEAGFDDATVAHQPALWRPPEQERPGPWRAWWQASDWPGRENANGLVFASKGIVAGDTRALAVKVFSDGDWAFLDDGPVTAEDIVLTHLHHVLRADPSLEPLRNLNPGTVAVRETPEGPFAVSLHGD